MDKILTQCVISTQIYYHKNITLTSLIIIHILFCVSLNIYFLFIKRNEKKLLETQRRDKYYYFNAFMRRKGGKRERERR